MLSIVDVIRKLDTPCLWNSLFMLAPSDVHAKTLL